ncbi:7-cyano-7-deazaguanine synthase QueC [Vampirovibrio sp.]|uniref:7-cyano-7-deazaguanine synthase QueC n=1 Tax=Vampirovibrio sp. TaxID=2717857 RepID=UPI0035948444
MPDSISSPSSLSFSSSHSSEFVANCAVVLLSGGLDSTVALAEVLSQKPVACALTFDYGQRAVKNELKAAQAIAAHYQIAHRVIALPWISELLPTALTPAAVLKAQGIQEQKAETDAALYDVNRVWVPNRNGLFLNIGACFAEALKANTLVFGANAEEGVDFPDNTPAFRDKLSEVFAFSTLTGVQVETPVGELNKIQIIERGLSLKVPFHLIWSCYEETETQCGACPSCIRVKNAQRQVEAQTATSVGIAF